MRYKLKRSLEKYTTYRLHRAFKRMPPMEAQSHIFSRGQTVPYDMNSYVQAMASRLTGGFVYNGHELLGGCK